MSGILSVEEKAKTVSGSGGWQSGFNYYKIFALNLHSIKVNN